MQFLYIFSRVVHTLFVVKVVKVKMVIFIFGCVIWLTIYKYKIFII